MRSCHDLSEGGLAVALAEMCFAGGLGADVSLAPLAVEGDHLDDATRLFSESNTRFLVEVPQAKRDEFLKICSGTPLAEIGADLDVGLGPSRGFIPR